MVFNEDSTTLIGSWATPWKMCWSWGIVMPNLVGNNAFETESTSQLVNNLSVIWLHPIFDYYIPMFYPVSSWKQHCRSTQDLGMDWDLVSPEWWAALRICCREPPKTNKNILPINLVGGLNPSEKWWTSSVGMIFHSQLFLESHRKFHGSSHHQSAIFIDSPSDVFQVFHWKNPIIDLHNPRYLVVHPS